MDDRPTWRCDSNQLIVIFKDVNDVTLIALLLHGTYDCEVVIIIFTI